LPASFAKRCAFWFVTCRRLKRQAAVASGRVSHEEHIRGGHFASQARVLALDRRSQSPARTRRQVPREKTINRQRSSRNGGTPLAPIAIGLCKGVVPMRKTSFIRLAIVASGLAILVSACGSDSSSPTAPSTPADVTVTIQANNASNSYSPNPVTMRVGQTIAWRNADSIAHTATQDTTGFNTGSLAAGATSTATMMSTAGTFPYHCTIHPGMVGTVTVQ
jgi:plastocyanin